MFHLPVVSYLSTLTQIASTHLQFVPRYHSIALHRPKNTFGLPLGQLFMMSRDADIWAARLSAAKRQHSLQHCQLQWDRLSVDDFEAEDDVRSEFACPYCYEDFDIATLCSHMEDEHFFDSKGVVCPVCAMRVPKDMIGHMTLHHGHLLKIQGRHRLRMAGVSRGAPLSLLGKEYRELHLQALLGSGAFQSSAGSLNTTADSLLSALAYNFPVCEPEDLENQTQCIDENLPKTLASAKHRKASLEISLSVEERQQKLKQASILASYAQQLVVSTLMEDS